MNKDGVVKNRYNYSFVGDYTGYPINIIFDYNSNILLCLDDKIIAIDNNGAVLYKHTFEPRTFPDPIFWIKKYGIGYLINSANLFYVNSNFEMIWSDYNIVPQDKCIVALKDMNIFSARIHYTATINEDVGFTRINNYTGRKYTIRLLGEVISIIRIQ